MSDERIERKIIIGLITNTDYLLRVERFFDYTLLQSTMATRLATWCLDYYKKYRKAPGLDIEAIYLRKLRAGLPEDIAEEIEEDILPGLSEEFVEAGEVDVTYLVDETFDYMNSRYLERHSAEIDELLEEGRTKEAEQLANAFTALVKAETAALELSSPEAVVKLREAFNESYVGVIEFPGALGQYINHQLVKGGFVTFMGSEKRGKTFTLLLCAEFALKAGKRVAFFQAGDMTEKQQIKRVAIKLARKSDLEKYSGEMWQPVKDCVLNQTNMCDKEERECNFGVFDEEEPGELRKTITLQQLQEAHDDFGKEYSPCYNCKEFLTKKLGTPWVKKVDTGDPLTEDEAVKIWEKFFKKHKNRFRLDTYANGTLSIQTINSVLEGWRRRDGWEPDLIVIDYADLLVYEGPLKDYRHQQNEIWKGLRGMSQANNEPLVLSATQADSKSYRTNRLSLDNFSEDKRKYGHITAMYGLNQDPQGREKALGIMCINEIAIREGESSPNNEVYVLQNLKRGMALISSYF